MVTVFTPTYNRAHLLPKLYRSLQIQTCKDFEWLIIDDGSSDNTEIIVKEWIDNESSFPVRYYKVPNGGKMRAINMGASLAKGEVFCGIDSDDWFYNDAISAIIKAFKDIEPYNNIIGVSFAKNNESNSLFDKYIDCKNFDRVIYGIESDRILIFYTDKMRKYKIPVWKDEKFTPESVFIDQMALDGYKMRYYQKSIYGVEYQTEGLSDSSWRLLRDNPMGYAMMYNQNLIRFKNLKSRCYNAIQMIALSFYAGHLSYLKHSNDKLITTLVLPIGIIWGIRRCRQFRKL